MNSKVSFTWFQLRSILIYRWSQQGAITSISSTQMLNTKGRVAPKLSLHTFCTVQNYALDSVKIHLIDDTMCNEICYTELFWGSLTQPHS